MNEEMMENTREETFIEGRITNVEEERLRNVEKRMREDSEEIIEEEGFTTVKRKPKRILRSNSQDNYRNVGRFENNTQQAEYYEVCLTSKTVLPKMVGMAKLFKSQNINDILTVKYKSPYKIFIKLKNIEDTNKVLNCEKFRELEFRCQRTDQLNIIYGIVRNIDLELEDSELAEIFESESDICAVKRLKRLTNDGQWVNSEVIRVAFKGSNLPSYIYGYGCRFKVESYLFPVTQCSSCWKFGHMKRFCPTQKIKCPKCGKDHDNCETVEFSCINCKGPHMALNKSCPVYLKEKMIRDIMSKNSCSYKVALDVYLKTSKNSKEVPVNTEVIVTPAPHNSLRRSYRDVLTHIEPQITVANTCMDTSGSLVETSESEEGITETRASTIKQNKKQSNGPKKQKEKRNTTQKYYHETQGEKSRQDKSTPEGRSKKQDESEKESKLTKFYTKLKEIWLSDSSTEQKLKKGLRLVLEEIMVYVVSYFKNWDIVSRLYMLFKDG